MTLVYKGNLCGVYIYLSRHYDVMNQSLFLSRHEWKDRDEYRHFGMKLKVINTYLKNLEGHSFENNY